MLYNVPGAYYKSSDWVAQDQVSQYTWIHVATNNKFGSYILKSPVCSYLTLLKNSTRFQWHYNNPAKIQALSN